MGLIMLYAEETTEAYSWEEGGGLGLGYVLGLAPSMLGEGGKCSFPKFERKMGKKAGNNNENRVKETEILFVGKLFGNLITLWRTKKIRILPPLPY